MPRIFIIDDDSDLLHAVRTVLKKSGYEVETYNDWLDAKNAIKEKDPQLILLDVFMRGIDGLAVCQQLKGSPFTRHIPILLFSGYPRIAEKAIDDYGADDFLAKPFEVGELLEKVHSLLSAKGITV
ncbi:MAG: response regulator [Bacteroidota bacterium]|nr:response regulator [Bacteroidota bacterium]